MDENLALKLFRILRRYAKGESLSPSSMSQVSFKRHSSSGGIPKRAWHAGICSS